MNSKRLVVFIIVRNFSNCQLYKNFLQFRPHHVSLDLETYYDFDAIKLVIGYFMFHCIIYAIPVGRTMTGPVTYSGKKVEYRFNGIDIYGTNFPVEFYILIFISAMLTLILSLATYAALVYWKYPVTIVYDKMLPIAAFSCVLSFILNALLHVKVNDMIMAKLYVMYLDWTQNCIMGFFDPPGFG